MKCTRVLIFQNSWQEQDSDTEDEETTGIHDNKDQEDNWTVSGDSVYLPPFDPSLFPSFPYPPPVDSALPVSKLLLSRHCASSR